jgi:hypothetical protein
MPVGALVPNAGGTPSLVVVVDTRDDADNAAGTVVERIDLATGARTLLAHDALGTQAPSSLADGTVSFVIAEAEGRFAIAPIFIAGSQAGRVAGERATGIPAAWLTPARGAPGAYLAIGDGTQASRIVVLHADGTLATARALRAGSSDDDGDEDGDDDVAHGGGATGGRAHGAARLRSAAIVRQDPVNGVVVERGLRNGRAEIVDGDGRVLARGLAGMDPLPLATGDAQLDRMDDRIVLGAGTKAARIRIAHVKDGKLVDDVVLDAHRAGIASPRAAALVHGVPVVIAWLDRGASLPGEAWRLTPSDSAPLLAPRAGASVQVYGVVPDGPAAASKKSGGAP